MWIQSSFLKNPLETFLETTLIVLCTKPPSCLSLCFFNVLSYLIPSEIPVQSINSLFSPSMSLGNIGFTKTLLSQSSLSRPQTYFRKPKSPRVRSTPILLFLFTHIPADYSVNQAGSVLTLSCTFKEEVREFTKSYISWR